MPTFDTCYNFLTCIIAKRICLQAIFSVYVIFPMAYILKRLQIASLVRGGWTLNLPGIVHGLPLIWKIKKNNLWERKQNKKTRSLIMH